MKRKRTIWDVSIAGMLFNVLNTEFGSWLNHNPVGTNSDKVPKVTNDPPSSTVNISNFNTQNNSYNYTRINNTNTNIYQNTNNINILIPPLPTRNLPQTLSASGSSNTTLDVRNTVKKSLANRRYGSLLTNPFYEGDASIAIYTDLTEDSFLNAIDQEISNYEPPILEEGELPDALDVATAFISFNDQGYAVPVPSLEIINQISSYYGAASKTSGFEVTGLVNLSPVSIENVGQNSSIANYPPLVTDFSGELTSRTLWELLGYEETDFKETSIKQIIRDFRDKIYDDDDNLLEIGENFETTEQFIAGAIATLFFSSEGGPTEGKKLWELLGYSENAFKGKSIEGVIKDFRDKIYDDNSVKDIDNNFENLEQLLVGVVSSLFYREGLDRLPVDVEVDDNTTVTFKNSLEYLEHLINNSSQAVKIWELLGYEETEFKETSIEQIIRDFLEKIYDVDDEDKLLDIGDNFNTTEQFITGSIATLFYRLGLNKLPVGDKDNPTRNLTDIILILLGIMNLLKGEKEKKLWELLGYSENDFKGKSIEEIIKDFGEKIYLNKPVTSINDNVLQNIGDNFETLEQFIAGSIASLFYRGGLHRLPGKLPESLSFDTDKYQSASEQPSIFIEDMMEYNEYLIKNLDEIFGRFPLNFTYKTKDDSGTDQEIKIKFENIAEVLLEMAGLVMDINNNTDVLTNIGLKNLAEGIKSVNGAYLTLDVTKAILDYLGCDYEETLKDRTMPITGDAASFPEYLKESQGKILGIKLKDRGNLKTNISTLLINTTIAKLALAQKKDFITGDAIRDLVDKKTTGAKDKYDKDWNELIEEYNKLNNTDRTKFPKAKVKDKSINKP